MIWQMTEARSQMTDDRCRRTEGFEFGSRNAELGKKKRRQRDLNSEVGGF
jgi:hypothetical protein